MPQSTPSVQNKDAYMVYRVGGRMYAAPVSCVLEVILTESLLPMSDAASYIVGITHFRGKVIPVIDTLKRLSLPSDGKDTNAYTVVFEVETDMGIRTFGALVDKVLSVGEFSRSEIKDVDVMLSDFTAPSYIKGVIEQDGGYIIVVSPSKLISNEDYSKINNNVSYN